MTAQQLLARHGIKLESTAPGRHYTTCPKCSATRRRGHQGNKVLGVTIEGDGSVRWGCNHCGWTGPEKGSGERSNAESGKLQTYNYRDAEGVLQFQKVRNPPGSAARFYCRRPDGNGGWINSLKGINHKPLYRWPEILRAREQGHTIAIVEGEKDCDNLWALGIPATCNFDGAADITKGPKVTPKWKAEYSEALRGASLVVFNDNDPQGYSHADIVCRVSSRFAKRVRRLDLAMHWPEIPKGGDVSDWLAASHVGGEELCALMEQAPDYIPPEGESSGESPASSDGADGTDAEIERLAKLSVVDYENQRKAAAEKLGVRASILDRLVQAKRAELGLDESDGKLQGQAISFPEPEPWPDPVKGAALLDALAEAIRRHVVLSDTARDAAALWVLHAYLIDGFLVSPRLGVTSPVKGCGKTTLLDVLGRLVPRPLPTANVTAAALFRVVESHRPTLLVDEADTFLYENDELRGVLNSGHRKGGAVLRTVGDDHEPRAFQTFCPTVIALIGSLPDTLHDRALAIELKRKLRTEKAEPFRPDRADQLDVLARKAVRWAKDSAERINAADPPMPDGIINRAADNWRPLLAIADAAGEAWGKRARAAAEAARIAAADDDASLLELLLADIRDVFAAKGTTVRDMFGAEKIEIPSAGLVEALKAIEGRPWADGMGKNRDKALTQNVLARMLRKLKPPVTPELVGSDRVSGYVLARFEDAFDRYLPPEGVTQPLNLSQADEMGTSGILQPLTPDPGREVANTQETQQPRAYERMRGCEGGSQGETSIPRSNGHAGRPLDAPTAGQPGLSSYRIRELAEAYTERAYANAQENEGNTRTAELDAWLRQRLADEMVLPEFVEVEFQRIMDEVFRT